MASLPTVFIVDDDPSVRDSLAEVMRAVEYEFLQFESAEQFLKEYEPGVPGCLLLDVRMSGMDGITLCEQLVADEISIPTIIITGHADHSMTQRAVKSGVVKLLEKPYRPEKLIETIQHALKQEAK